MGASRPRARVARPQARATEALSWPVPDGCLHLSRCACRGCGLIATFGYAFPQRFRELVLVPHTAASNTGTPSQSL